MDLPDVSEALVWEVSAACIEARVRTVADMSEDEISKLEVRYGCKVNRKIDCSPVVRKAMVHGWRRFNYKRPQPTRRRSSTE